MNASTSRKFRSAWMPPAGRAGADRDQVLRAVARTSLIRSASCGVRDRALRPATGRSRRSPPFASPLGNRPMSTAPATASSSSSRSSRLSWQPSQEANFQTASRGLVAGATSVISGLPDLEPGLAGAGYGNHGPFRQTKARSHLASGRIGRSRISCCVPATGVMRSAPARHRSARPRRSASSPPARRPGGGGAPPDGTGRIEGDPRDQARHHADRPAPVAGRMVHRHLDLEVAATAPGLQFAAEDDVLRTAGAIEQRDPAESLARREYLVERRGAAVRGPVRRPPAVRRRPAAASTGQAVP